jgi:integrase
VATITEIKNKDGSTKYRVQVRRFKDGKLAYSEAKTFDKYGIASAWGKERDEQLDKPGAVDRAKAAVVTLGHVLQLYEEKYCAKVGRTKAADIKRLQGYPIADTPIARLTSEKLIAHIRERCETAKPQTAGNDLIWIDTVLKAAYPAFGIKVDLSEIEAAKIFCRKVGLMKKSDKRLRRPTADELDKLSAFFKSRDERSDIPMYDVMWFAIHSGRRQAEITRLEWADNDKKHRTGMVRDLKHPRKKEGNHRRFKFTDDAWEIIERQPETGQFIFPYDPKSIGAAFNRACHILEIVDLHFHDLRHEATSRLFEKGYPIHEVQLFTLHDSWETLRRYVNLRPEDLALR